jgi:hypothetical protein
MGEDLSEAKDRRSLSGRVPQPPGEAPRSPGGVRAMLPRSALVGSGRSAFGLYTNRVYSLQQLATFRLNSRHVMRNSGGLYS